jgi:hypothetical protein
MITSRRAWPAFFSAVVDDPAMKTVLGQVEGSEGTYCFELVAGLYLVGCCSQNRDPGSFHRDCRQAIQDAERVRDLLSDVELDC